uniref:Uncharacterized protein n=1 Tax=Ulva partita TaxID=1605170 RepID=A0A1C9ZPL9_9CHLO|nr:hypothetical protein [Ulva partita]
MPIKDISCVTMTTDALKVSDLLSQFISIAMNNCQMLTGSHLRDLVVPTSVLSTPIAGYSTSWWRDNMMYDCYSLHMCERMHSM